MKLNELPVALHEPAVGGDRIGTGESFDSGTEKLTVIGAFGATPWAPLAGVTDVTLNGGGTELVVDVDVDVVGVVDVVVDPLGGGRLSPVEEEEL
jgi:hypothetical protein